jgi:thiol-disulfide isomerase/thioredoxin
MLVRRIAVLFLASTLTAHAGTVRSGDEAPAFVLPDGRGAPVSLESLRGKVVCVEFWASWCAVCRSVLPAVDDLARRLGRNDVEVIAVNIDQQRSSADRFLAERLPSPALRVLYDPGGSLMSRFGASTMPAVYVIDRRGVVRLVETSEDVERLKTDLESRLRQLAAEPAS